MTLDQMLIINQIKESDATEDEVKPTNQETTPATISLPATHSPPLEIPFILTTIGGDSTRQPHDNQPNLYLALIF